MNIYNVGCWLLKRKQLSGLEFRKKIVVIPKYYVHTGSKNLLVELEITVFFKKCFHTELLDVGSWRMATAYKNIMDKKNLVLLSKINKFYPFHQKQERHPTYVKKS